MRSEPLLRELRETLDDAGLRGAFLVRNLHTGQEIGIEPDLAYPTASLVKVPLAAATVAHTVAIEAGTAGGGHTVPQLDVTRASSGSARAYVDLLQELWRPSAIAPEVAEGVRDLMAGNLLRHRLTPDFSSDATRWSAKTGTMLNLRHEVGVVEHDDGSMFAVAALVESRVPATTQPEAEAVLGSVARRLRDHLRATG